MLISRKEVNITTMRKNVIKITAIALLSAFALTACDDDIVAKPTGYDDNSPIITDIDVYNNDFKSIYDSIRSGNLASDVLDELLYQYSVSVFGNYNKVTAKTISAKKDSSVSDGVTLKEAVASANSTDLTKANEFINKHEAFWTKNSEGQRVNDKDEVVEGDVAASTQEIARLKEKWDTIEKRIAKALYSSISGGSYSDRGIFSERKFLASLASNVENKVANYRETSEDDLFEGVISPSVEDYDIFNETIPEGETYAIGQTKDKDGNMDFILHRKNYQSDYKFNQVETAEPAIRYVEDHIIPDIYRQLLVEQYILDETFSTLGRTSARNISVLAIKKNSEYPQNALDLMNTFLETEVFDAARTTPITLDTFKKVSRAWVGTFMDDATYNTTPEYTLMNAAIPGSLKDSADSGSTKYFQGTAFGDMMEEMAKIDPNPALSENENNYTGSNSYSIEVGKQIKKNELDTNDYTFTGWYVKSVGVSNLPDSIKNQLFDINVANALSGKTGENCVEYYVEGGKFNCNLDKDDYKDKPGALINVVGKITGLKDANDKDLAPQYFLRNTNRIKGDPFQNDLLFESDGTYYMILVEDAIRSTNLDKQYYGVGEDKNGNEKLPYDVLENYVNEIVEIVADNDTYKTLSKKHWVEKMELQYHDQVVYDYFKSNFPELFDDDDSSDNE